MAKKPGAKETSARDRCPMCGEPLKGDSKLLTCVTCGGEGGDECCMTAGVGTECVDCQQADEED